MKLTKSQLDCLFSAYSLHAADKGFVPEFEAERDCEHLTSIGWLRPERQEGGELAYFWTAKAETLIDMTDLLELSPAAMN